MNKITIIVLSLTLISCKHKINNGFFDNLAKHCGQTYTGQSVFPADPNDSFAGKKLIMEITECSDIEIRVPFKVGEDASRTWIITKTNKGLLLKHDHRHEDGTPDKINMYGGYADDKSTSISHSFIADSHTITILPEAKTNVWTLNFDNEKNQFIYYLERHDEPRFKAVFDMN